MSRRKGELTSAQIDRDWPHQVALKAEFVVEHFHDVEAFTSPLSRAACGHSVVHENTGYNVYCFADEKDAEAFLERFDGIPFNPKDRGKGANWIKWRRPGV